MARRLQSRAVIDHQAVERALRFARLLLGYAEPPFAGGPIRERAEALEAMTLEQLRAAARDALADQPNNEFAIRALRALDEAKEHLNVA